MRRQLLGKNMVIYYFYTFFTLFIEFKKETRRKVLKVAKIKDANYGCKDEGNEVISQSSVSQLSVVYDGMCDVVCDDVCDVVCDVV